MKKLLKTKQDQLEFVFWIETLRAGVLPRSEAALQSKDGYCCLGVGVACVVPEKRLLTRNSSIKGGMPVNQPASPIWLQAINVYCAQTFGYMPATENDKGVPHAKIANKLMEFLQDQLNLI